MRPILGNLLRLSVRHFVVFALILRYNYLRQNNFLFPSRRLNMTQFRKMIQKHKKMITVIIIAFSIFISGGTFPFVNMSNPQSFSFFFVNILITAAAYIYLGMLESVIFDKEALGSIFLLNVVLTVTGTALRFVITLVGFPGREDFTVLNLMTHLIFIIGISTCSCLQNLRYNPEEAALPKDFREQQELEEKKKNKKNKLW